MKIVVHTIDEYLDYKWPIITNYKTGKPVGAMTQGQNIGKRRAFLEGMAFERELATERSKKEKDV